MIELKYSGQNELLKLDIDRVNKRLWITSSKTSYKRVETEWKKLFDSGKETSQDSITSKLDDPKFIIIINMSMAKLGYTRI